MSGIIPISELSGGSDTHTAARLMLIHYGVASVVLVNADAGELRILPPPACESRGGLCE